MIRGEASDPLLGKAPRCRNGSLEPPPRIRWVGRVAEQLRERSLPFARTCVGAAVRIAPLPPALPRAMTWPFCCLVSGYRPHFWGGPSGITAFAQRPQVGHRCQLWVTTGCYRSIPENPRRSPARPRIERGDVHGKTRSRPHVGGGALFRSHPVRRPVYGACPQGAVPPGIGRVAVERPPGWRFPVDANMSAPLWGSCCRWAYRLGLLFSCWLL